jgi:glycerol uptake facilitator-like aquaporin
MDPEKLRRSWSPMSSAIAGSRASSIRSRRASLNPARSIGPALVGIGSNPGAVAQLWLFIIAPLIGAGAAGFVCRTGALFDAPKKA